MACPLNILEGNEDTSGLTIVTTGRTAPDVSAKHDN